MAAAAILDFENFKFLTVGTLKRVELRLRAKFCRNRSNRSSDMAIFRFFKMAAVRHLVFSKVGNFNFRSRSEAQCASSYQISRRSVEPFRRYGRFSIFQDGGRRHLGFWKFQIFNGWDAQEGLTASVCQILAKSLKTRLRYGDFSIFQDGGRPPSWIGLHVLGPPTKSTWWSLWLCKIWW